MKKYLLIALSLLIFAPSKAQKVFSIEEAVTFGNGSLVPKTLSGLDWVPNSHTYYHYATKDGNRCLVLYDVDKKKSDTITLDMLNIGMKQYNGLHRRTSTPIAEFKSFPTIVNWKNKSTFRVYSGDVVLLFNITNYQINAEHGLEENRENETFHAPNGSLAYTVGQNLFVKYAGSLMAQITFDSSDGIVNGTVVHRNEFGINGGLFWSGEGRRLAYYKMDESMVTAYPIMDIDAMPAKANTVRYPFAGATSHQVSLWVLDTRSGKSVKIKTGGPLDQYLTNIAWDPSEKYVYIAILNREQNHLWLNQYNAETGEFMVTLFEEKHSKYVEPENPMLWIGKSHFVWQSERDGFNHLYLYNKDGIVEKQLTSGKWMVTKLLGSDKKNEYLFFMATKQSPLNANLYRVNLKTGEINELTSESGVHTCKISEDGLWVLDQYSSPSVPRKIQLINTKDGKKTVLKVADNPLKDYELGQTSIFTIPSKDKSVDLYCRMIKPSHFDSTKKYPVVVYVYGGPHLQIIRNSWLSGSDLWMQYMAQQGYIVFSLDNRGTPNRGLEFENAVFRKLGTLEMEDQLAGVDWLKKQTYVDPNRMAVHGWSFGGFMTTSLMTRTPGTFQVGVAGGPVIDWTMYEVMYTERYMDSPQENTEGYKTANLLNYVENLDGKLLMIHGTSDDVVLWQHSLLYVRECVKKKVMLDYFVYPEHLHNVSGRDRVHLMRKVTEYIVENLR